jgi:hypothetical protein
VQRVSRVVFYLLLLFGIAALGMIVHETGHGVIAIVFGGEIRSITIMPGIQLYPTFELQPWDGWVAQIAYSPLSHPWQSGFTRIMGSGLTAMVGYCAIAVLFTAQPQGSAQFAWLSTAILFVWDITAYSVFPALGLKHWIFIGGIDPEPVIGAAEIGIAPAIYCVGIVLHAVASNGLILCYLTGKVSWAGNAGRLPSGSP